MIYSAQEIKTALEAAGLSGLAYGVSEHLDAAERVRAALQGRLDKQTAQINTLMVRINALSAQVPAQPGESEPKVTRAEMVAKAYESGQAALGDALAKEFAETDAKIAALEAAVPAQPEPDTQTGALPGVPTP